MHTINVNPMFIQLHTMLHVPDINYFLHNSVNTTDDNNSNNNNNNNNSNSNNNNNNSF